MEVKAPDLGVEQAEVAEILIKVGDIITQDNNIVLLESDKAAVEVPSTLSGKVTAINVSVGDQVSEGTTLIEVEESDDIQYNSAQSAEVLSQSKSESKSENTSSNQSLETSANQLDNDDIKSGTAQPAPTNRPSDDDNSGSGAESETTYALPDLGVDEAEVAEVMVAKGDSVEAEQSLLLIESDKAAVEVPAPVSGIVAELLVNAGDIVSNGQNYIVIRSGADSGNGLEGSADNNKKTDNSSRTTNTNTDVTKKMTSGRTHTSPKNLQPSSTSTSVKNNQDSSSSKLTEAQVNEKLTYVYAGPAVRKLARQLGVDITEVKGTAQKGRIIKEDVFGYVKTHISQNSNKQTNTEASAERGSGLPNLPDMSNKEIWGEMDTQDLTRLQKVSIPQLNYNTYLPQVTQFDLADITDTEALRGELKGDLKKQGIGLTILAFIVKATAYALTKNLVFNSHLSDDNTHIIIRKTVNIGIAVATDDGLIVPVIKNAQDKGINQLAIEIGELAGKARDKKLTVKELQGASFTVSSQGNLGGTYFTPLVNWPQVGILGVSEATTQPRWNKDTNSFEPRLMLPLSLSYDHRVINGADAAVFTRYIATLLADPRRILL